MIGDGIIQLLFDNEFFNVGAVEKKVIIRILFSDLRIALNRFSIYTGNGTLCRAIAAAFNRKSEGSNYDDVFHAGTESKLMPCEN